MDPDLWTFGDQIEEDNDPCPCTGTERAGDDARFEQDIHEHIHGPGVALDRGATLKDPEDTAKEKAKNPCVTSAVPAHELGRLRSILAGSIRTHALLF